MSFYKKYSLHPVSGHEILVTRDYDAVIDKYTLTASCSFLHDFYVEPGLTFEFEEKEDMEAAVDDLDFEQILEALQTAVRETLELMEAE